MSLPDIVCTRELVVACSPGEVRRFSIERRIVHHSPDGWEWGYAGSGPSDLALAILDLYVPPEWDGYRTVPLWKGECSTFAWAYHQDFKREFVATLPREGGIILRAEVIAWIRVRWPDYNPPE